MPLIRRLIEQQTVFQMLLRQLLHIAYLAHSSFFCCSITIATSMTIDSVCSSSKYSNNNAIMNAAKSNHNDNNDMTYAFQGNAASLSLPEPPDDVQPIYDTNLATTEKNSIIMVPSRMNYVVPSTTTIKILRDVNGVDHGSNETSISGIGWFTNHRTIWIHNGRRSTYTLDENGFELVTQNSDDKQHTQKPIPLLPSTSIDYMNRDHVIDEHYPYCINLLQQRLQSGSGSKNVIVFAFDHNVRKQVTQQQAGEGQDNESTSPPPQKPIGLVHGDYTTISGPRRIELLSQEPKVNDVWFQRLQQQQDGQKSLLDPKIVQECLNGRRRYALINVWRSIDPHHPVMAMPLACVDSRTVDASTDLRTLELHYVDRIGENYLACHPSSDDEEREHQWVYFPYIDYDESLLIKQWDSFGDIATGTTLEQQKQLQEGYISTMALHSAFIDPTTPKDAPLRQSIEVRCVAIWDP